MKKTTLGILAMLATAGAAGSASAQICAGFPTIDGQGTLGASVQFPEGADFGDVWGVEASYNARGPVTVFGGLTRTDGGEVLDDVNTFTAGLALEFPALNAAFGSNISACPLASVSYTSVEDIGNVLVVPVGFGIGTTFAGGGGLEISPVIAPQIIYARLQADEDLGLPDDEDSESDTNVGITGNLILSYRNFWVGGVVAHVFQEDADPTFGIRFGFRL